MTVYRFDGLRLDTDRMEVTGPDGPIAVEPQVFDVLHYLVAHHERLVTKEELLDNVWGDRFVSESALTTRIKQARRLVGDDGQTQSTIRTIRGRGFRFVADLRVEPVSGADRADDAPAMPDGLRALPPALEAHRRQPFVGRGAEIAQAVGVMERGAPSTGWVVLLGEPGIGKTRLAARLAQHAVERGAAVLFGRCSQDLAVPYQPVIEALRSFTAGLADDDLRSALGRSAHELTRLVPDLAGRLPEQALPGHADAETQRYRLFEAVNGWLESCGATGPTLFVIDDAHWATDSTMQLLGHLARASRASALTMVLTARDTAPDASPRLDDLVGLLSRDPGSATIALRGLDVDAAAELIGADADARTVVARTAGNPLLMQALASAPGGSVDVASAVRSRMAGVDAAVREALTVASLAGLEFDLKVVARALRREEHDLIDDLDEAVAAGLLHGAGGDAYRFTHDLVRASLSDELSSPRRARWHGRIGAALEEVHVRRPARVAMAVAHHYALASVVNPELRHVAVGHLRTAAREAVHQLSYAEAIDLLERARSLTDDDDHELQAVLAIAQGEAETLDGRNLPAIGSFDAAFAAARAAGRPDLMADAALHYEDASWRPGHYGGPSIERLEAALDRLDPGEPRTRARLMVALGRAHGMGGDLRRSDAAFAEAAALISGLDDPLLDARARAARHAVGLDAAAAPDLPDVRRLMALVEQIDDVEVGLLARQVHLRALARLGMMDDYRSALRDMGDVVSGLHSSFWDYIHANHVAMLRLYEGDLPEAEQATRRCADIASRLVGENTSGTLGLRMFVIRREQDRLRHLAPLIGTLTTTGTDRLWTPGLALLLAEIGHRDQASEILRDFRDHGFGLPMDAMWATVMTLLIELAVLLDDAESCELLAALFASQEGLAVVTGHGIVCFGSADRSLGMLATVVGDLDRAERLLRRAVSTDARNGSHLWAGHARARLAIVRERRGDRDGAEDLRARVRDEARRRGYAALERLAAAG